MFKYIILLSILSCSTTNKPKKELDSAFCKNTLQHDIHRDQCLR